MPELLPRSRRGGSGERGFLLRQPCAGIGYAGIGLAQRVRRHSAGLDVRGRQVALLPA